jgi:hypothetical protein
MDETEDHHVKWNKPDSERQISHFLSNVSSRFLKKDMKYRKLAKMSCFSSYLFSAKWRIGGQNRSCPGGEGWHHWEGGGGGKGGRRMNMVQKMCTHICKCKNGTCWNCSINGRGEDKRSSGRDELKYDNWYIVRPL